MTLLPKITVITIVFNAVDTIEQTILSVIRQTYLNLEYLIIDGGSTDGTIDIIKKYNEHIACWISEPDKGIYDAMNKGIERASGDWLNFMNAGDLFYDQNTLEKVFITELNLDKYHIIYGNSIQCFSFGKFIATPQPLDFLNKYMIFCHQSSFVRLSVLRNNKFDIAYKIVADYKLFYQLYKQGYSFKYFPINISIFDAEGGISSNNDSMALKEVLKINGGSIMKRELLKIKIKSFLRIILPTPIYKRIVMRSFMKSSYCEVYYDK